MIGRTSVSTLAATGIRRMTQISSHSRQPYQIGGGGRLSLGYLPVSTVAWISDKLSTRCQF